MKSTPWIAAVIFSPTLLFAQFSGVNSPLQASNGVNSETGVLNSKLVAEGSSLPEPANVLLECGKQVRAHEYSDTKGNFTLRVYVTDQSGPGIDAKEQESLLSRQDWKDCELYAHIPGYQA